MITSKENPKIKRLQRLKKPRERKKTKRFLIEGYREIARAVAGGIAIEECYACHELFLRKENEESLLQEIEKRGGEVLPLASSLFRRLSYRDRPDGLLAVGRQPSRVLEKVPCSNSPFFVVAEGIEKPGNLGTILRSSDAAGVDGVFVSDPCTDVYNPNVVRASVGCLFTQFVMETSRAQLAAYLDKRGIQKVAATPHAKKLFTQVDLSGPIALLVGSEQYGLQEASLEEADIQVRIPMLGIADSLNVAQATTLVLYEALRQRHSLS
ncbi:MAG: RNA methyltransferase [Chlamydiota bacterium]